MQSRLTSENMDHIWQLVHHAVELAGSHAKLFANRLEFFEESGRVRFCWPSWMSAVKGYLIAHYGEKSADAMLLSILREVMVESNYTAYLRRGGQLTSPLSAQSGKESRDALYSPYSGDDIFEQKVG